jgi:hypothetical protein
LGHGFALSADLGAALFMDIVKERARYETGDKQGPANKRARTEYAIVPELTGGVNLWWYPTDGIQVRFGYDFMAFFNTVAGRNPVSFNYGGLDPAWDRVFRVFDGFNAGIAFIF